MSVQGGGKGPLFLSGFFDFSAPRSGAGHLAQQNWVPSRGFTVAFALCGFSSLDLKQCRVFGQIGEFLLLIARPPGNRLACFLFPTTELLHRPVFRDFFRLMSSSGPIQPPSFFGCAP